MVEYGGQRIAAIEVKATAAPRRCDPRHLEWLPDNVVIDSWRQHLGLTSRSLSGPAGRATADRVTA